MQDLQKTIENLQRRITHAGFECKPAGRESMAHLFIHRCEHANCEKVYASMHDLIIHIENVHIDFDAKTVAKLEESQPQAVPMSLVLRYGGGDGLESVQSLDQYQANEHYNNYSRGFIEDNKIKIKQHATLSKSFPPNYLHSENWLSPEMPRSSGSDADNYNKHKLKRYSCPVTGCTKRYKNLTGIRHHILNHHDVKGNVIKPKKEYKCHCGKEYKTIRGMQSHSLSHKESMGAKTGQQFDHYKLKGNYMRPNINYPNMLQMGAAAKRLNVNNNHNNMEEKSLNYTTLDRHSFGGLHAVKRLGDDDNSAKDVDYGGMVATSSFGDMPIVQPAQDARNMYSGGMYPTMPLPFESEMSSFATMFGKYDYP